MGIKTIWLLAALVLSDLAYGHGEEKPGPHGGFIRMPAAFHTEVVPVGKNQIRIYLLDINMKNPTVESSSVKAVLTGKKGSAAKCEARGDFYLCTFSGKSDLNRGELSIEAKRGGQSGSPVSYKLPLGLQNPKASH
jgi:hypothetical protein